jgi:hypothetical protein
VPYSTEVEFRIDADESVPNNFNLFLSTPQGAGDLAMTKNHRRTGRIVGIAAGALLAPPLIALLSVPIASADPGVTTLGPYDIDGYGETFAFNGTTYAVDNYLTGTYDGVGFDLDTYFGPSGSDSFDVLLTDPGVLQLGIDDVDGSISYVDNFFGIDFIPTDPGLTLLG